MKFLILSLIFAGIILIFNLGGITTPVGGYALQYIGDLSGNGASGLGNFTNSTYWLELTSAVVLVTLVGARAGLFGNSAPPISYALGTLIITLLGLAILTDFLSVYGILWSTSEIWIRGITTLIFVPLSIGYVVALKGVWEGND